MKMHIRSAILAAAAVALAAAAAPAAQPIEGSGNLETRVLDLGAFTQVDLGGAFDVEISIGEKTLVEVTIDDNLWENLDTGVRGGELSLDWDKNCTTSEHCRVTIVTPALEQFSLHGAGNVDISDLFVPKFKLLLRGAGDVTVAGRVDRFDAMITGAGNCRADGLEARDVAVVISGVGDCEVHAVGTLDATVSGVGKVTYRGDPEIKRAAVSGMGSIDPR
jgi:hypothetical protein